MAVIEDTTWDVDAYRQAHESDEHWQLKWEFMEAHKSRIPEDRLVCLAQVYQNVELLGCKYSDDVMRQVAELGRGINNSYKENRKNKLQRTFVKASDAAESRAKGHKRTRYQRELQQDKQEEDVVCMPQDKRSRTHSFRPDKNTSFRAAREPQKSWVADTSSQPVEAAMASVGPSPINMKTLATIKKYQKASQQCVKQQQPVQDPSSSQSGRALTAKMQRSQNDRCTASRPTTETDNPLSKLILIQREYLTNVQSAITMLQTSAALCSVPIHFDWNVVERMCTLYINGCPVATERALSKKDARTLVATKAVDELTKHCYTIKILKCHGSSDPLSPDELSSSTSQNMSGKTGLDKPIGDGSMGSKLLKMMGWTGGGLGKEGNGIIEPIRPFHIHKRQGLGRKDEEEKAGVSQAFKGKIKEIIHEFARGVGLDDIAFSSEFTKEQREAIHLIVRQHKLRSRSYGKGSERYIVVSRKLMPQSLLHALLKQGPTEKYEVIPPTSIQSRQGMVGRNPQI